MTQTEEKEAGTLQTGYIRKGYHGFLPLPTGNEGTARKAVRLQIAAVVESALMPVVVGLDARLDAQTIADL